MKKSKPNQSILQSVQRGLRILKLFSLKEPVWGISEIALALNLSKSTVSRITNDLVKEGFLEKNQNKYRLGIAPLCLSGVITSHIEIHRESKEVLKTLVSKLEETAHIGILENFSVTYLHKVECKNPVPLLTSIGGKNPATCTASGKVLLAFQSNERIQRLIETGLPKIGPNSITNPQKLYDELIKIRMKGYSISIEEMQEDIISIGAPIQDYTNEIVAAISIVGSKQRRIGKETDVYIKEVVKAAEEISSKLGFIKTRNN